MAGPSGGFTPANPPSLPTLQNWDVNRNGQVEVVWQPFYDILSYGAAGSTALTFFQRTVGSAANVTLAETNMRATGQFPSPWQFLCTGLEVTFKPAGVISTTAAAATVATNINDVDAVMNGRAWLDLFIGSKSYLQDGPLSKFAPQFRLAGLESISGTYAAGTQVLVDYATAAGRFYSITPVRIPMNQAFNVTLNFPVAIAVTGTSKLGVILDGFLYRLSQ